MAFTEELLQVIRQQRHLATRVVIATQEPTIAPSLLELCTFTIVHRFTSPGWLKTLREHLAGASDLAVEGEDRQDSKGRQSKMTQLFKIIVSLEAGEGLLFCPTALVSLDRGIKAKKLGMEYAKIHVRKRLTIDGGKSLMAE